MKQLATNNTIKILVLQRQIIFSPDCLQPTAPPQSEYATEVVFISSAFLSQQGRALCCSNSPHIFAFMTHLPMCGVMGSLAVKEEKSNLTYIPQPAETQGTAKEVFTLPAGSWEEETVLVHRVPTQRVTQSQHGREAAQHSNGEFQVNALCFHANSWFALKPLKSNSLRDSGGMGDNYQVTRLPFRNKVLVLLSVRVTGIHPLRLLQDVLSYSLFRHLYEMDA